MEAGAQANGKVYPKGYQLVRYLFLFSTQLEMAWTGLLIYFLTDMGHWARVMGDLYPSESHRLESFVWSIYSLIAINTVMIIVAFTATFNENLLPFLLLILYRTALALFYFIRYLMAFPKYGLPVAIFHVVSCYITIDMYTRIAKITRNSENPGII